MDKCNINSTIDMIKCAEHQGYEVNEWQGEIETRKSVQLPRYTVPKCT